MKFFKNKSFFIVFLLIILGFSTFILFNKKGETLKKGIEISLQEDFKIKETLGQVFFLDEEDKDTTVSSSVNITSMTMPCSGEFSLKEILGEKCIVIYCNAFESVCATADGKIESNENGKITIRHPDGKLSSYYGVTCLLKCGEPVKKGDTVGYAKGEMTYKLYENCVALDPLEYLNFAENK